MNYKKSSNFILTLNNKTLEHYEDILKYITGRKGMCYILVTEHIGNENKHYHLYVQFEYCIKLSIKKLFGAHIEMCYGSAQKNIEYCKALDKKHKNEKVTAKIIYEQGKPLLKGGDYSVKRLLEYDCIEDLPDYKMVNTWKRLKMDQNNRLSIEDFRKKVKVYYIQGESGVGKTEKALEIINNEKDTYGEFFNDVKYENGFWIGCTDDCKIALYDDWRDSHMKPSEFINFIDYNKHNLNIKNGCIKNNYELIIITSVQRLDNIYLNVSSEPRKQWVRRINLIDMY